MEPSTVSIGAPPDSTDRVRAKILRVQCITAPSLRLLLREDIAECGGSLQYIPAPFREDPAIVLAAVTANGLQLQWLSKEKRADPDIVMTAVKENGLALQHASDELKADYSIVLEAVASNAEALALASDDLRRDKSIVMAALDNDVWSLENLAHDIVFSEEELAKLALDSIEQDAYVVRASMMSGRQCVFACDGGEDWDDVQMVACQMLDVPWECNDESSDDTDDDSEADSTPTPAAKEASVTLLLNGNPVPVGEVLSDWPGVEKGKVVDLVLVVVCAHVDEAQKWSPNRLR